MEKQNACLEDLGVKRFSASVRPVKTEKLMLEEFCFTARGRKVHPFDDNNNHVSAAQLRKYPKWRKKTKNLMILKEKYSAFFFFILDKRWYLTV